MSKTQKPFLLNAMKQVVGDVTSRRRGREQLIRKKSPDRDRRDEDLEETEKSLLHAPTLRRRRILSGMSESSKDEKDDRTTFSDNDSSNERGTLRRRQPHRSHNRGEGTDDDTGRSKDPKRRMPSSFERKQVEGANAKNYSNNSILCGYPSCIRKPPSEKLRDQYGARLRTAAEGIPELHFIGEVCSGVEMENYSYGMAKVYMSCAWSVEWGKSWSFLEGEFAGQTQYSHAPLHGHDIAWNHPIDIHLASASMQGWPRIILQLWNLDDYGRTNLLGYGFTHLPTSAGKF
mmetsp:Transcript_4435/g.6473  ORF Transcript_4435/g.6473 Transcript_4435/m.6473 type:complete len:289 (-) Transcript_4435:2152-3018(-)